MVGYVELALGDDPTVPDLHPSGSHDDRHGSLCHFPFPAMVVGNPAYGVFLETEDFHSTISTFSMELY